MAPAGGCASAIWRGPEGESDSPVSDSAKGCSIASSLNGEADSPVSFFAGGFSPPSLCGARSPASGEAGPPRQVREREDEADAAEAAAEAGPLPRPPLPCIILSGRKSWPAD